MLWHATTSRCAYGGKAVQPCTIAFGRTAFPLRVAFGARSGPAQSNVVIGREAPSLAVRRSLAPWTVSSPFCVDGLPYVHCGTVPGRLVAPVSH